MVGTIVVGKIQINWVHESVSECLRKEIFGEISPHVTVAICTQVWHGVSLPMHTWMCFCLHFEDPEFDFPSPRRLEIFSFFFHIKWSYPCVSWRSRPVVRLKMNGWFSLEIGNLSPVVVVVVDNVAAITVRRDSSAGQIETIDVHSPTVAGWLQQTVWRQSEWHFTDEANG